MHSTSRLFLLVVLLFSTVTVQAQTFDYEDRPGFDFRFQEADIQLKVNPDEDSLAGSVLYTLKANISGADTLQLDAPSIEIDSVRSQERSLNYTVSNENLKVAVSDSSEMGQQYRVEIFYRASPTFGLLKSSEGTMWTSLLPRSVSHWLPVKDHPRASMITTLTLDIPAQSTAFASGVNTDSEVLSTSRKKVTFRTSQPIPVTALSFGLGTFRQEGVSVGIKRINSYAETGSIETGTQRDLVNKAGEIIREIESITNVEYPYQRVHIALLNDHYWEQKSYGASTVFLYKNRGDWTSQLRRALYGQWYGVYKREEQWATSWPISWMQMALHRTVSDSAATIVAGKDEPALNSSTVYHKFSAAQWNQWQGASIDQNKQRISNQLVPVMLRNGAGVVSPDSFRSNWYQMSGQASIEMNDFLTSDAQNDQEISNDSLRIRVDYDISQGSNLLNLVFNTEDGTLQQPLTLPLNMMTSGGVQQAEITVSGSQDSASVNLPQGTRGVYLASPQGRSISLDEHKPVPFLLYQLRNGESTYAQKQAASSLGYHTDNPDLQLALNDLMQQQMAPAVEAALLRSYGKITDGADGTQQRFLEALQSNEPAIRLAALEVLGNYQDPSVKQRIRSLAESNNNSQLSNQALQMYLQQADSVDALQFTNTLVQQDTSGSRAIVAIQALGSKGNAAQSVKLANYYIEPVYSYSVRRKALQILLKYDESTDSWKKRVTMLLNDYDPRVRFLTIQNLQEIPGIDAQNILSSHQDQEYDARVVGGMGRE